MRNPLLLVLFFLSGVAGLVYELAWVRQLTLVFGGTTYAITTVVVAFMAGLGLGSYIAGRSCRRLQRTARAYGLLEISIGCYALLVPLLFGVAEPVYRAIYPVAATSPWLLNALRFLISGVILLVPTTCMGATLPILVQHVTRQGRGLGLSVGFLYGINTLGAVLGVLLAGFVLIPGLGLINTTRLAAAISIAVGTVAILVLGRVSVGSAAPDRPPVAEASSAPEPPPPGAAIPVPAFQPLSAPVRHAVLIGFAVSGFAAMVYQITWTRALVLSLGSSTYSFTCILSAFILGLALGSLAVTRVVDRWGNLVSRFGALELAIGIAAILIVPIHGRIPFVVASLVQKHSQDFGGMLILQFFLVIAVTIVPTLLMGAIFPLVIRILARDGGEAGAVTGRAYAVNTIGTIAGSFLAGFILIRSDILGVQNSIILASVLNGIVGFILILIDRPAPERPPARRAIAPALALIAIPVLAFAFGRWDPRVLTSAPFLGHGVTKESIQGGVIDYFADGVDMTVSVYHSRSDPEHFALTVNGKADASTGVEDMTTQLLLGHLPALLAPRGESKDACVIGLGSGMTLAAVARHPSFERLDCAEISSEVIKGASYFQPYIHNVLTDDPRVRVVYADGRNHLLLTDRRYDLIVSEPSNPWISGVASLFTREFFSLCRSRLTDEGVLAVWLQGYSTSIDDFRMVLRSTFDVFDDVSLWWLYYGDFLIIMRKGGQPLTLDEFLRRWSEPSVRTDLYRVGLHRPAHILGRYVLSGPKLREWVEGAPIHTDDNSLLEFSAPRSLLVERPGLTDALSSLQQPVLDNLFPGPLGSGAPPELDDEIATVVAVQWTPVRVNSMVSQGDALNAIQFLLEAYRADPTNPKLYAAIVSIRQQLLDNQAAWAERPEVASLVERMKMTEAPVMLPRRNAGPADLVRVLRKWAEQSAGWGHMTAAVDHLAEARAIDPADPAITRELIDLLDRSGQEARADSLRAGLGVR